MDLSIIPTFIKSNEMKVSSLLVLFGLCIAGISYFLAVIFNNLLQLDKTLELTDILTTSILGSGALAIAAVEFTKKS